MSATGLKAAIEQPARKLKVAFDPGFTERILEDVGAGNLEICPCWNLR